jgi:predicted RNA-binding Zn-ribbon protein involved in translation (DUF1610 family)
MLTIFTDLNSEIGGMIEKTFPCPSCGALINFTDSVNKELMMTSPLSCPECRIILPRVSYIEKEQHYRLLYHKRRTNIQGQ